MTEVITSKRPAKRRRSLTGWEGVNESSSFMRVRAKVESACAPNWSPAVARNRGKGIGVPAEPRAAFLGCWDGVLSAKVFPGEANSLPRANPSQRDNVLLRFTETIL